MKQNNTRNRNQANIHTKSETDCSLKEQKMELKKQNLDMQVRIEQSQQLRSVWQQDSRSQLTGQSSRTSRSVPSRLFNRFEVRQHVFDQYNEYMVQKERLGEQPDCEDIDDTQLFEKSPSKQDKKIILAR